MNYEIIKNGDSQGSFRGASPLEAVVQYYYRCTNRNVAKDQAAVYVEVRPFDQYDAQD